MLKTSPSLNEDAHAEQLAVAPGSLESDWRRFVFLFVGICFALCTAIALSNYLLNPMGLYPTHLVASPTWNARRDKAQLLRKNFDHSYEAIILGGSHVMKLAPQDVERLTGLKTFNAGVEWALSEDALVMLRDAVEGNHQPIRLVIIGIDVDTFAPFDTDAGLRQIPDLARYLGQSSPLSLFWERATALLSFRQSALSMKTLIWLRRGAPPDHHLDQDGYLHYDHFELGRAAGTFRLQREIDATIPKVIDRMRDQAKLSTSGERRFEDLLEYCRARHIDVKIFVTPLQPQLRRAIQRSAYEELHAESVKFARMAANRHGCEFYDLSDLKAFRGSINGFYDGEHVDEVNAQKIAQAILKPGSPDAF